MSKSRPELTPERASRALHLSRMASVGGVLVLFIVYGLLKAAHSPVLSYLWVAASVVCPFAGVAGLASLNAWMHVFYAYVVAVIGGVLMMAVAGILMGLTGSAWPLLLGIAAPAGVIHLVTQNYIGARLSVPQPTMTETVT